MLAFYTHAHVVDGVMIVHAHPFKKAASGTPFHGHTQAQFELINSLSSLNTGDDVVPHFEFAPVPLLLVSSVILPVCRGYVVLPTVGMTLRAPPAA